MNTLTLRQAFLQGKNRLSLAGLKSPAFDALCLFDAAFGIGDRAALAVHGDEPADPDRLESFNRLVSRRTRETLQYILGSWEFDGMALAVGEGVLIPREDTMALVTSACDGLKDVRSPRVLDLCAGSGAVGLAVAHRLSGAEAVCAEKSPLAMNYLLENIAKYGEGRVSALFADVLLPPDPEEDALRGPFDCIVSNPPYIPARDIDGLEWEVRLEPRMALDGGADGLDFYRAICAHWLPLLRPGGLLAFEAGYDIRDGVIDIMRAAGVDRIGVTKDFGGVDRCIFGTCVAKMQF